MDDLDISVQRQQFLLEIQIADQLELNKKVRQEVSLQCEDCEDFPKAILHGGTRSKYCTRCIEEHLQITAQNLMFI